MRKTMLICALIVVFAVGTAFALGIPGMGGGGGLKKETKKLSLGQANASLKKFEGDPLAPQPIEYITIGDAEFDDISLRLAKLEIVSGFATKVVADANAKLDAAKTKDELTKLQDNVTAATGALQPLVQECTALGAKMPQVLSNLKSKLTSNPMLAGDVAKVLDPGRVKTIGEHISKLITDLASVATKIKDKIATLV